MFYSTPAIILKTLDFNENDRLIHILSKKYGKLILRARGSRKNTSKLAGHLIELNYSLIIFTPGKNLLQLVGAQISRIWPILRSDFKRIVFARYGCFLIDHFCEDETALSNIYNILFSLLDILDKSQISNEFLWALSNQFQASFIRELGLLPRTQSCAKCESDLNDIRLNFSFTDGSFIHQRCGWTDYSVSKNDYEVISAFLRGSKERLSFLLTTPYNAEEISLFFANYLSFLSGRNLKRLYMY